MKHEKEVRKLKEQGYNCSEALYTAFKKDTKMSDGYPAPRSIEGKCGALLTALKILEDTGNGDKKEILEKEFIKRFGYSKCVELMRYEGRCNDYVGESANWIDGILTPAIVVASNNQHKIKEIKEILSQYHILQLSDIGFEEEIEENGKTFEENALIKAKTIHNFLKKSGKEYIVLADDSGLCVDSLNGEPGVYSARYAGVHGDEKANRKKLLEKLEGKERTAYFNCTIAVVFPNGKHEIYEGKTYGMITTEELGKKDFGYDCIFYSNDLNKTFGEATEEEKNSVSHRARALEKVREMSK